MPDKGPRKFRLFNPKYESWDSFRDELNNNFQKWRYREDMKVPFLLGCLDNEIYYLLCKLIGPGVMSTKSYEELCELLNRHYHPISKYKRERETFQELQAHPNEPSDVWMGRIKKQADLCSFGIQAEEIMLNKFLSGLRGKALEICCQRASTLTLNRAVRIAHNCELEDQVGRIRDRYEGYDFPAVPVKIEEHEKPLEPMNIEKKSVNICVSCGKSGNVLTMQRYQHYVCSNCSKDPYKESIPKREKPYKTGWRPHLDPDDVPHLYIKKIGPYDCDKIYKPGRDPHYHTPYLLYLPEPETPKSDDRWIMNMFNKTRYEAVNYFCKRQNK